MNSTQKLKSLVVNLSHSEFFKLALKYGALKNVHKKNVVQSKPNTNTYNLRKKEIIQNIVPGMKRKASESIAPAAKKMCKEIVKKAPLPKLVVAEKSILASDMVVIAKMRTYPAWPAHIRSLQKTYVTVKFFGDNTSGNIPYSGIGLVDQSYILLKANLNKKINGYEKAVRQMERILRVPNDLSLFNA